jgi:hypothetical protein
MSVRKASRYPVLRFVDGSFVVNNTNVPGLQAVSLFIDAEHPVTAVPATGDGEKFETVFAPNLLHFQASASCDAIFARRYLDDLLFREVSKAEQGQPSLPIVFARDRSDNLVGYLTARNVAVRCDEGSVQAMTGWGRPMRIVEYDRRGVPRTIIAADVRNPRGAHSGVDFDSLRITEDQVSFTRWYWADNPPQFTHRQDIEIKLPRSMRVAPEH